MAKRRTWYKRGSWWRRIRMNHKYKDRLFRYIFRDKKDLLALYNALNNSNYTNVDELEIVRHYICQTPSMMAGEADAWSVAVRY